MQSKHRNGRSYPLSVWAGRKAAHTYFIVNCKSVLASAVIMLLQYAQVLRIDFFAACCGPLSKHSSPPNCHVLLCVFIHLFLSLCLVYLWLTTFDCWCPSTIDNHQTVLTVWNIYALVIPIQFLLQLCRILPVAAAWWHGKLWQCCSFSATWSIGSTLPALVLQSIFVYVFDPSCLLLHMPATLSLRLDTCLHLLLIHS